MQHCIHGIISKEDKKSSMLAAVVVVYECVLTAKISTLAPVDLVANAHRPQLTQLDQCVSRMKDQPVVDYTAYNSHT